MNRPFLVLFGLSAYALFNIAFLYMLGFLQDVGVPKSINQGAIVPPVQALAINLGLVFLFGFFHSLMARDSFKHWWTRVVSPDAERPVYVLQSAVFLLIAMVYWQPMPDVLWQLEGVAALVAYGVFALGVFTLLTSTFLIDHFELFGLKHIWFANRRQNLPTPRFVQPFLYRWVRHPMQLGMIILLFATPNMTVGHLVFATAMTAYVLVGLYFEERALLREFGDDYRDYRERVPMLIPRLVPRRAAASKSLTEARGVQ